MEDKVQAMKTKLAWKVCTELLNPPLSVLEPFKFGPHDTDDVKARKRQEYEKLSKEFTEQRRRREPELLSKFEAVIDRVRASRGERPIDNEDMWSSTANVTAKYDQPEFNCDTCGNKVQLYFRTDERSGDTICLGHDGRGCGNVVQDHQVHSGAQFRKFEDEEDRNHFGPAADPLMPDSENLRTVIVGKGAVFKRLSEAHQSVEMNLSNIDNDDRRTRKGFRTKQKKEAFAMMEDISANLFIHEMVVARAKEEFARYRDVREHVHDFPAVVAACLILAFEDISRHSEVVMQNQARSFRKRERPVPSAPSKKLSKDSLINRRDVILTTFFDVYMVKWTVEMLKIWFTALIRAQPMILEGKEIAVSMEERKQLNAAVQVLYQYIKLQLQQQLQLQVSNGSSQEPIDSSGNVKPTTTMTMTSTTTITTATASGVTADKAASEKDVNRDNKTRKAGFGTTTVASRMKRIQSELSSSSSSSGRPKTVAAGVMNGGAESKVSADTLRRPTTTSGQMQSPQSSSPGPGSILSAESKSGNSTATQNGKTDELTAGKLLLKLNVDKLLHTTPPLVSAGVSVTQAVTIVTVQAKAIIKDALRRRREYELALRDLEHEIELENKRVRIEESRSTEERLGIVSSLSALDVELEGDLEESSTSSSTKGVLSSNTSSNSKQNTAVKIEGIRNDLAKVELSAIDELLALPNFQPFLSSKAEQDNHNNNHNINMKSSSKSVAIKSEKSGSNVHSSPGQGASPPATSTSRPRFIIRADSVDNSDEDWHVVNSNNSNNNVITGSISGAGNAMHSNQGSSADLAKQWPGNVSNNSGFGAIQSSATTKKFQNR